MFQNEALCRYYYTERFHRLCSQAESPQPAFISSNGRNVFDNVASESEVDDTILQNAEMDVLREALSRLPENERLLLTMKYVDESSDKEIAAILHIGQDSVRMYLSRARKHLLALFKEVEEDG